MVWGTTTTTTSITTSTATSTTTTTTTTTTITITSFLTGMRVDAAAPRQWILPARQYVRLGKRS